MPSTRPCAAFEPIAPDYDVRALVEGSPNFEWVSRIQADMIEHHGMEAFEKLILVHVILGGKPLVVEGYHERLDPWIFTLQWLRDNCGSKVENARDLTKKNNVPLTIAHYLNHMAVLTNQWTSSNYKSPDRQRMYLKDIDCPQIWADKVRNLVPPGMFYMNDTTGDIGGLGSVDEADPSGHGTRRGQGIAKAGDLMSSLPKEMRAENLMCYIGHEGTYTPAHREMCASLGQNLMVECSTGKVEDGKATKPGSSIWFMTETKERRVVSEYWLSRLGHDIEIENHFAQINAWKAAPFKVYVVEQRVGDFILIPPLAPHQVWNRGTRTMKVAWNRTTIETLEMALDEALPRARMVCRDEQYKNKAIIYFTLQKYSKILKMADKLRQKKTTSKQNDVKLRQVEKDFRRLQGLYTRILVSETFAPNKPEKNVDTIPYEGYVTCSYCRCNIFNRFLTCPSCILNKDTEDEGTYDVCMDCYAMGRSCACISKLKWVEQFPWAELIQQHESYRHQILQKETKVTDKSPKSLKAELEAILPKLTLAQICQSEITRRPWTDISKPPPAPEPKESEEVVVDDNGKVKKKKTRHSEKFLKEHARCHVHCHWEPSWKQAKCSTCDKKWCYGILFRAYDQMPQDVLADPNWSCPSCQNICSCRHCCKNPGYQPFTPAKTLLGHNTKAVADPRSVESLVDFSHSNIAWIQKAGDDQENTLRLHRHKQAAEADQSNHAELGDNYAHSNNIELKDSDLEANLIRLAQLEGIPIDPSLEEATRPSDADNSDDEIDENPEGFRRQDLEDTTPPSDYHLPTGGVLRSVDHVYDVTDAVTFEYPDPNFSLPLPPQELEEQVQEDTYLPVVPQDEPHVEMVDRKRKRERLDEGQKAYAPTKSHKKKKPSARKSMIVKLPIESQKLAHLNRLSTIAQSALNGTEEYSAPVLGSDLRALNASGTVPSEEQPPQKKSRIDAPPVEERDDEFRPGRRDRRKAADGYIAEQEIEATRRSARMRDVVYEDPSEDEFNEVLPVRALPTKLAEFERINSRPENGADEDGDSLDNGMGGAADDDGQRNGASHDTGAGPTIDPALQGPPQIDGTTGARPTIKKSVESAAAAAQALATAKANQRAKMAVLRDLDMDDESDDDDVEGSEGEAPPASSGQASLRSTSEMSSEEWYTQGYATGRPRFMPPSTPSSEPPDSDESDAVIEVTPRVPAPSNRFNSINAATSIAKATPIPARKPVGRSPGRPPGRPKKVA